MKRKEKISIAVETSCRVGGVALGRGSGLIAEIPFDSAGRHATQLIVHLQTLLKDADLVPQDVDEVYVSSGPGSFTGLRVGITAVRTLAQMVPDLRCVAVSTALVIAENAREMDWEHLGVIMDAREESVYVTLFTRENDQIVEQAPGKTVAVDKFLASAPRPLLLVGEALAYQKMFAPDITIVDGDRNDLHLPTAQGVWRIGRQMAEKGNFIEYHHLLPTYARPPVTTNGK